MKNLKVETRTGKNGNDYKFISGDGTYYLSALKRAKANNQTEVLDVPGEAAEFTKHLLYNRILKGFICKLDSWDVVDQGLKGLIIPDNYLDQVKKVLPKAAIFKGKTEPAKSSTVQTKKEDNSIINVLVSKLQKYDRWDNIPTESIPKLKDACDKAGVKIAQVRKAYEATKPQTESIQDLEL